MQSDAVCWSALWGKIKRRIQNGHLSFRKWNSSSLLVIVKYAKRYRKAARCLFQEVLDEKFWMLSTVAPRDHSTGRPRSRCRRYNNDKISLRSHCSSITSMLSASLHKKAAIVDAIPWVGGHLQRAPIGGLPSPSPPTYSLRSLAAERSMHFVSELEASAAGRSASLPLVHKFPVALEEQDENLWLWFMGCHLQGNRWKPWLQPPFSKGATCRRAEPVPLGPKVWCCTTRRQAGFTLLWCSKDHDHVLQWSSRLLKNVFIVNHIENRVKT